MTDAPISAHRRLLDVAAKLTSHRRQEAVAVVGLTPGAEALIQRGAEHVGRHALVDRRQHRPSALTGVGHTTRELLELWRLCERGRGQIEQPRRDDAAAAPYLGDRWNVELVLVVARVAQRCRLGILLGRAETG